MFGCPNASSGIGSAVFRALSISKRKASLLSRSVGKRRAQTRSAATRRAARLDQTLIEQLGDNIEPWCLFIRSRSATQRGSDCANGMRLGCRQLRTEGPILLPRKLFQNSTDQRPEDGIAGVYLAIAGYDTVIVFVAPCDVSCS